MSAKTKAAPKGKSKAQLLFEAIEEQRSLTNELFLIVEKLAQGDHVSHIELRNYRDRLAKFGELVTEAQTAA
jgi:hypothetical protein